jgi:transposase-like protein
MKITCRSCGITKSRDMNETKKCAFSKCEQHAVVMVGVTASFRTHDKT